MKRYLLFISGMFLCTALHAMNGHEGIEERVFLDPHVRALGKATTVVSNVGARIPSTTHVIHEDACKVVGLGAHLLEIADRVQRGSEVVFTAPASFGVIFNDGSHSEEDVQAHIDEVLAKIGFSEDSEAIANHLNELSEVYRATFARREGQLMLITNEKELQLGEVIWRKLPMGAEINVYHSEEEYLVSLQNAGFKVEEIKRPCFFGEVKWRAFNESQKEGEPTLGAAYREHNPFTLFYVRKA